jgi:hypothetical protein
LFVVFQTPPEAAVMKYSPTRSGLMAMSLIRPDMRAGPIDRAFRAENVEAVTRSATGTGVASSDGSVSPKTGAAMTSESRSVGLILPSRGLW